MKNPFKKEGHTTLIAAVAIATVAAGTIAFLLLTKKGQDTRAGLKKRIKAITKDATIDAFSKKTEITKKAVKKVADHIIK